MAFSLTFSPEFFLAEGEPYDRADYAVNSDGKPVSVYSALCMMPADEWESIASDLFGLTHEMLTPEAVLDLIRETDTCTDLTSPVEVWIDAEGDYRVLVY